MVKPPDGFIKYRIQEWGARQVHLNGGAASGECVVGVGWWYLGSQGKRVHLYGGAAA